MNRTVRRLVTTTGATAGALALLTGTALAHECYVGTGSTRTPHTTNWFAISVADAAATFGMLPEECVPDVTAGNAALKAEGLPLSIRVFERFTLAEKAAPHTQSDGKGLEHFEAGSTLADDALATYVEAAC